MKTNLRLLFLLIIVFSQKPLRAQTPTVGLFLNSPQSYNGYTLFSGYMGDTLYLINNCGKLVKKWHSNFRSSRNPAYLTPNGEIVYAGKISQDFNSGAGLLERQDWNGNVVWSYKIADTQQCAHHSFMLMPGGNLLVTVWEKKSPAEQIAMGRNPAAAIGPLWVDKIVELKPIGSDSAQIVWEWKLWDHLIQNLDPQLPNFGDPKMHPELVDINLLPGTLNSWAHVNNVDYNPELDQVMISCRNFNELFIIDHTTSTAEAAGHSGGHSQKGGDLLYRWGDAENYHLGTPQDQKLFHQHDAHWIPAGLPGAGDIMIFNNGEGRSGPKYSTVEIIHPPLLADSSYVQQANVPFGPSASYWTYPSAPDTAFYSQTQGSAQRMPNGNFLIAESNTGDFQEVDAMGVLVWRYVSPVNLPNINTQGHPPGDNAVFKIRRYYASDSAFMGETLVAGDPIEIGPYPYNCTIVPVDVKDIAAESEFAVFPNPASTEISISFRSATHQSVVLRLTDVSGRIVRNIKMNATVGNNRYEMPLEGLRAGVYILQLNTPSSARFRKVVLQ